MHGTTLNKRLSAWSFGIGVLLVSTGGLAAMPDPDIFDGRVQPQSASGESASSDRASGDGAPAADGLEGGPEANSENARESRNFDDFGFGGGGHAGTVEVNRSKTAGSETASPPPSGGLPPRTTASPGDATARDSAAGGGGGGTPTPPADRGVDHGSNLPAGL